MKIATTIIILFFSALGFSLAFTPMVRALGIKLGAMDIPQERNVHTIPIPRIGGLAVFLSFAITLFLANIFLPRVDNLYVFDVNCAMRITGALVILSCGLWDDFSRLKPWTKLFFQIAAASLAFIGSAKITGIFIGNQGIQFNLIMSYLITVLWFLLFINAINLIDGLDGLASGLVFFTCVVMVISTYKNHDYLSAFYFAILGGAVLGFLRYNFNPATVFLGDTGSYFLGYVVAILAILGSTKSHVGTLMLIPLLALGVPIFDSILSPIRRFIRGRPMFQADTGHVHHVLLSLGLSSRKAVLLIYGITMGLCILAILSITFRGKGFEGLALALLMFGMILLVRKMGYFEYLAFDKLSGWFLDVTDIAGLSQKRRSFLSLQIVANKTHTMDELWDVVGDALAMLKFDRAELYLGNEPVRSWNIRNVGESFQMDSSLADKNEISSSDSIMRFEIPISNDSSKIMGKIILIKDLKKEELQPYTIRRMESLRRTLVSNIMRLKN